MEPSLHWPFAFRFDARSKPSLTLATHYSDELVFGQRAMMRVPPGAGVSGGANTLVQQTVRKARLVVERVRESDRGLYKCRTDFKKSPTRNIILDLSVLGESLVQAHFFFWHIFNMVMQFLRGNPPFPIPRARYWLKSWDPSRLERIWLPSAPPAEVSFWKWKIPEMPAAAVFEKRPLWYSFTAPDFLINDPKASEMAQKSDSQVFVSLAKRAKVNHPVQDKKQTKSFWKDVEWKKGLRQGRKAAKARVSHLDWSICFYNKRPLFSSLAPSLHP